MADRVTPTPAAPASPVQRTANKRIFRVVLTGGPCAGKTTALSLISGSCCRAAHVWRCADGQQTTFRSAAGTCSALLRPTQCSSPVASLGQP